MTASLVNDRYVSHHRILAFIMGGILLSSFAPVAVKQAQQALTAPSAARSTDSDFQVALKQTLKWEGSTCDNVAGDSGGLTCKGITDQTYRSWRKANGKAEQPVTSMSPEELTAIYKSYWERCQAGDKPMPLSFAIMDTCVNFDESKIKDWFQNLPSDPKAAAATIFDRRMAYRRQRAAEKPDQAKFVAGWLNRDEDGKKFAQNYAATPAPPQAASNPAQSVVSIYAGREQGTAVSFGNRRLVTCAHVVDRVVDGKITVKLPNGGQATAIIKKQNRNLDLALLELDQDIPAIALAPELPKPGEAVTAIGNRFGKHQTKTEGTVLSAEPNRPVRVNPDLLKPGNSGGPVVNTKGELIGIAKAVSEKDGVLVPTAIVQEYFLNKI
ncbi:MAG TPA: trypsin-like peptidase domain-containing protein [Thermosynechococcaceae cyanobacterium]